MANERKTEIITRDHFSKFLDSIDIEEQRSDNPKIDKLLEDGRKENNKEERKEIYHDFQRFLVEDCPAVFLHELATYSISRGN